MPEAGSSGHLGRRHYGGKRLDRALTLNDLCRRARARLPRFALEYVEGGAEDEASLRRNREIFGRWRFAPRALVDIRERRLGRALFGRESALPIAIAPTGFNGLYWPQGDLALARAAAAAGIPFTQSTVSNATIEDVAAAAPAGRRWMQLYAFGFPGATEALIERAQAAGCEALLVTVDSALFGNREWDARNFTGPLQLNWRARLELARHPAWLMDMMRHGVPRLVNLEPFLPEGQRDLASAAGFARREMRQDLSFEDLAFIRSIWRGPLLVKGVIRPDDALRARDAGADGVVLSNHGGRQLDYSIAPIEAVAACRAALGEGFTILVDSGFRRGTDVVKALCLGADGVLIGRPTLWGLAAGGEAGAARALAILAQEIDRTLGLLGATSLAELGPHLLVDDKAPGLPSALQP